MSKMSAQNGKVAQRLSDSPMITMTERERSFAEWNSTEIGYPKDKCIHELFQEQVERTPDSVAVVYEDQELSYRELDDRSNQLAHYLRKLGAGPEALVSICLNRSLELIVGLLGIIKAGGAYVPMDPGYPSERLAFMMKETKAQVLLTSRLLRPKFRESGVKTVDLDSDWENIKHQSTRAPINLITPANLAYVIYTSGSTGTPKGVLVEHAGMVNLVCQHRSLYGTREEMRISQIANAGFDSMGSEIWPAILSGAALCIAPNEVRFDPELLQDWLIDQRITIAFVTTIIAERLLALSWPKQNIALRVLRFGGERFRGKAGDRHYPFRVYNEYGPTEDTVWTTVAEVIGENTSSIGRPIANHRVYVLDRKQNPMPVGEAGELCIAGVGLARGYLNSPELTVDKFIACRFSNVLTERLYRTGDLVRYTPNGDLDFLDRIDHQVKIRGFRIEPGEIEFVLSGHPNVRECVVIARENGLGNKQLMAYVVIEKKWDTESSTSFVGERLDESTRMVRGSLNRKLVPRLRSYLTSKLPDYMVPSTFVFLDRLPLTPNGKLDRSALPEQVLSGNQYVKPRTPLECKLAEIWQDIFDVERVGLEDNFFELGGCSLVAVRLANRLREFVGSQASTALILKAPTIAQLSAQLNNLTKSASTENSAVGIISRRPRTTEGRRVVFPASFAQRSLWLLDQLRPFRYDYNIPFAFRIDGDLDVRSLRRSFSLLVRRHEVLRTSFRTVSGTPVQVVAPARGLKLAATDLRNIAATKRFLRLRELIEEIAWTPFDLAQGPLFRIKLFRTGNKEHALFVELHHIIGDDWSIEILVDELFTAYQAFASDRKPELRDLPIQYGEYALWQREYQYGRRATEQLQYWRNQLFDLPALRLPADRSRSETQSASAANEPIELPLQLTRTLKNLGENEKATFFMTMLAAFQVLLARYTGQEDIAVGSPIADRCGAEREHLLGLFLNTLVLRTKLNGNPTFREVVRRVRKTALDAYHNQDLPFELVVKALAPDRDPSRNPLFQVMFNLMKPPLKSNSVGSLKLSPIEIVDRSVILDLTLNLFDGQDGVRGYINYNAALFDSGRVRRMAGHLRTLLDGIAANPDARISELPLLAPQERVQLIVEWNGTHREYPRDVSLHQFVERQVERSPNAVAVEFDDRVLKYGQLNRRANRLARHLQKLGVGPNRIVGILAERSFEMWHGILAILKAGGAYLPLDPTYPSERLAFLLQDAKPVAVLAQRHLAGILPNDPRILYLEEDFRSESDDNLVNAIGPENLAYVIYTSGSTGKPKGVLNSHGGLSNWLCWMQEIFPISAQDAMLQKSPFTFDVSIREFFLPLSVGGRMVIGKNGLHGDTRYLVEVIRKHNITAIHFVPPMLSAFLDDPEANRCTSLRWVMCSGDALTFDLRDRFFATFPHLELHNMWGPTEHAPESSYYKCDREPGNGIVPIGRPGANTQLYILDRTMQPVPIGVVGEVCLSGIQTALGYLARPELTAEKFVSNSFGAGILYKTGDLGRFRFNGVVEFVGRADHQIKLRGFRVELGEIETVLKEHAAVRDCVVIVRGNCDEPTRRLVAYLVVEKVSVDELRQRVRRCLPEYMVPTAFVFLEKIPVTSNGKLDRGALPAPSPQRRELGIEPLTLLQRKLVGIWQNILALERVGLRDNFFELGGNSLLAVRTVLQIERLLGKRVSLATFFQAPTIERLTVELETQGGRPVRSPLVAIQPHGSRPPFFGVHTLSGEVIFYRDLAERLGQNQPFYGLQSEGLGGGLIKHRSMKAIARYYVTEIRRVQKHGPYYLGGYCIGGVVAFEMAQQLRADGEEVACLVLIEADRPETLRERIRLAFDESRDQSPNEKLRYFTRRVTGKIRWEITRLQDAVYDLIRPFYNALKQVGGMTDSVEPNRSPVGRILSRAHSKYRPRAYPGRITLLRTALSEEDDTRGDLGWGDVAEGGVEIHYIEGEHQTVFEPKHALALAKTLDSCLRRDSAPGRETREFYEATRDSNRRGEAQASD